MVPAHSFYAVDRGMAILGFVKFGTVLLFLLCVLQISAEERVGLLYTVPASGCIIVVLGLFTLVTGILKDSLFLSGRFGGTFQYLNTMALSLMIGIIVLQFMEIDLKKYLAVICTLYGEILMTGSRFIFVLAIMVLTIFGILRRNKRWFLLLLPAPSLAAGIIYVSLTSDYQNIG